MNFIHSDGRQFYCNSSSAVSTNCGDQEKPATFTPFVKNGPPLRNKPSFYGDTKIACFEKFCKGEVPSQSYETSDLFTWCVANDEHHAFAWLLKNAKVNSLVFAKIRVSMDERPECRYSDDNRENGHLLMTYPNLTPELENFLIHVLKEQNSLESLTLSTWLLTPETATSLTNSLKFNSSLKHLGLYGCTVSSGAIENLMGAISDNRNLNSLSLRQNYLAADGTQIIFEHLQKSDNLTSLSFTSDTFCEKSATKIADYIRTSSALKIFHIEQEEFRNDVSRLEQQPKTGLPSLVLETVVKAVMQNNSIEDLKMVRLGIDPDQVGQFLRKINSPIARLSLGSNHLGDEGGRKIADALKANNSLVYLDISKNNIAEAGGMHMAGALAENSTIRYVSMADNPLGKDAGNELCDAVASNTTLKNLDFRGCGVDWRDVNEINRVIRENQEAQIQRDSHLFSQVNSVAWVPVEVSEKIFNSIFTLSEFAEEYDASAAAVQLAAQALTRASSDEPAH